MVTFEAVGDYFFDGTYWYEVEEIDERKILKRIDREG